MDEKRILVLGDSVTFGWGVSQGETFSDQMEPLLQEQTGARWQVINAGVNGYNSEQEAIYLRTEGMRYSPDHVLAAIRQQRCRCGIRSKRDDLASLSMPGHHPCQKL